MHNNEFIRKKIDNYLRLEKQTSEEIFNQLFLYVCSLESKAYSSDLYILAKLLKGEDLLKIVNYYDGDILKIPSKEEYITATLVSLCFYLKELKNWDWSDIKSFVNLPENNSNLLSSISIGRKINSIKENLNKDLKHNLESLEIENIEDLFKNFKHTRIKNERVRKKDK